MKKALILASVASMIEQFNMNNIKLLQELGYQVEVACNFDDGGTLSKQRVDEFKNELDKKQVIYYNISFSRGPFSLQNISAYFATKKLIETNGYEVVHLHSPIGGVCGRLACRKLREKGSTKVIYTAHGFHFYKGAPLLNWIIYYPIEMFLSKYTDCLITINEEDYEIAREKFKAKETKLVHGVGVDSKKFDIELTREEIKQKRKELGLEEADFVIIQIGELNKNKNQIMLIEAMRNLSKRNHNIKAILVGKGKLDKLYKQKIKEYHLESNVLLLGYRKDIPQLLKSSNCLVSLSYREGLPVNVIEAIIAGLPIIASNCRGNRDLVKDNINGYIIENVQMLIEKIMEVIERKKFDRIETKLYDQKEIEKKMKDIYMNL